MNTKRNKTNRCGIERYRNKTKKKVHDRIVPRFLNIIILWHADKDQLKLNARNFMSKISVYEYSWIGIVETKMEKGRQRS